MCAAGRDVSSTSVSATDDSADGSARDVCTTNVSATDDGAAVSAREVCAMDVSAVDVSASKVSDNISSDVAESILSKVSARKQLVTSTRELKFTVAVCVMAPMVSRVAKLSCSSCGISSL